MKGIAFYFMLLAVISVLLGMIWGIQMSATHNHNLSPAHAHLNLIGWVSMALFAIYYHLVPAAAQGMLAKLHLLVAALGLGLIVPGIVMALTQQGDILAKIGSILTLLSAAIFLVVVVTTRGRA